MGSGWQAYVAYINLGCYYLVGVPLGFFVGWVLHQGVMVRIIISIESRQASQKHFVMTICYPVADLIVHLMPT